MNTYNLTEIELTELLRKQRELCAKRAVINEDWYRGKFVGCILHRESIVNAPSPPLPISGAKKEDIPAEELQQKYLETYIDPDIDDAYLEGIKMMLAAIWREQLAKEKEDIQPVLRKFINVYEDDKGRFISDTYYETSDDAFEGRDPVNYLGTIEIIGDLPDMTNISAANREFHEQHPSKEQQKQSLIELMEADQRDGIYGVRDNAGWISVKDRLPSEGGRYWCYIKELTDLGWSYFQWNCSYNEIDQTFTDRCAEVGRVTHWMPLPPPPNSDTQSNGASQAKMPIEQNPDPQNTTKEPVRWKKEIAQSAIDQALIPKGISCSVTDEGKILIQAQEPVIDNLRDKFLEDDISCTLTTDKANKVFEWFKPYLKSNSEPVIDWDGLEKDFKEWAKEFARREPTSKKPYVVLSHDEYYLAPLMSCHASKDWLKENLSKHIK